MPNCVYHNAETGESRPVFTPARRGRPTAQVSPHLLSVTQSWDSTGCLELVVQGRLDLNTVLSFRDAAFAALGERPKTLRIDLTPLQVVEAAGIASLVTLSRVAQMVGVHFELKPSAHLALVFTETGLDRLMKTTPASSSDVARKILLG